MRKWRVIGRHRWVAGATISESIRIDGGKAHRFTATIRGYRNWKIFEGTVSPAILESVIRVVRAIRDQIDKDGEDCEALMAVNEYSRDIRRLQRMTNIFEHPMSERLDEYLAEEEQRRRPQ